MLITYDKGTRTELPMRQVSGALSDQDIANVAACYASLNGFDSRPEEPGAEAATVAEPDSYAAV